MPANCPLVTLVRDPRLLLHALAWTIASALVFGLVTAIIPNPVFARSVAPDNAAIAVWLLSAPLMGIVMATYTAPRPPSPIRLIELAPTAAAAAESRSLTLGGVASFGAFLAIGCPVCNKVALVLLGASGAMSVWAPIQPIVGVASLGLLAVTAAWRLRLRATGAACAA